jgi:hypothetical protein
MKRLISSLLLAFGVLFAGAAADEKLSGHPTATEAPFVRDVAADLTARFATTAAARKAGYIRYTDEDNTGAISYANRQWTSKDENHPSQLWYDVKGRLIGADFSVLQADSPAAPHLFGVDPSRWQKIGAHVHYGLVGPNGTTIYGGAGAKTMAKGGGTVDRPTAAALVAAGIAKSTSDVRFFFTFPAIWDLTVWVIPNRDGAFADANPDVKPAGKPGAPDSM